MGTEMKWEIFQFGNGPGLRGVQGMNEPPVRLCCSQRHWGPVCPDGKVMCCLCFERFDQSELNVTADGEKQDVCKGCAEMEKGAKAPKSDA